MEDSSIFKIDALICFVENQSDLFSHSQSQRESTQQNIIYIVGQNNVNLGLDCLNHGQLTEYHQINQNIKQIHVGNDYTIFTDDNNCFWAVGHWEDSGINKDNNKDSLKIEKCTEIKYFKNNGIKIKKKCTNIAGSCTFWISHTNILYANGQNDYYQLGIGDKQNRNKPTLINFDEGVMLTKDIMIIIVTNWCELQSLTYDVINLIVMFTNIIAINDVQTGRMFSIAIDLNGIVYSTGECFYGENGLDDMNCKRWKQIQTLKNNKIEEIKCGFCHSLFLESNGTLWGCGNNDNYQLGLGNKQSSMVPKPNTYFIKNEIRIKHIECGWFHSLAIDYNGLIYSWGGIQDGYGRVSDIVEPTLIEILKDFKIIQIKCGAFHSYAMTDKKEHYLFGSNKNNECTLEPNTHNTKIPFCINKTFKRLTNGKIITGVYLGFCNTIIMGKPYHDDKINTNILYDE